METGEILDRLKGVKKNNNGWIARCPAHRDGHPSLSVTRSYDGKTLLKCFAGCSVFQIVQAVGLDISDLFTAENALRPTTTTAVPIGGSGTVEGTRASVEQRDAVYRAMLEQLTLSDQHGTHLLSKRGLSDTTIANNLYASTPDVRTAKVLAEQCARTFDLRGVPGFYKCEQRAELNIPISGFFVPYRNQAGLIEGLQIRSDIGSPKYLWLSSRGYSFGCSSGAPIHFVKPDLAQRSGTVYITEGALKADCVSESTGLPIVAIAGVSSVAPEQLILQIRAAFPSLKKVVLAFDMDWQTNGAVGRALLRLASALREAEYEVKLSVWDTHIGKGLDTY